MDREKIGSEGDGGALVAGDRASTGAGAGTGAVARDGAECHQVVADDAGSLVTLASGALIEQDDDGELIACGMPVRALPPEMQRVLIDELIAVFVERYPERASKFTSTDRMRYYVANHVLGIRQNRLPEIFGWSVATCEAHRRWVGRLLWPERDLGTEPTASNSPLIATPGPQDGRYVRLYYTIDHVSNSFRVCPKTANGRERRTPAVTSRRSRRVYIMLKPVSVSAEEVAAAVKAWVGPEHQTWGYSPEYIQSYCKGILLRDKKHQSERAELDRIEALSPADALAECSSAEMAVAVTRARRDELTDERKRLLDRWQANHTNEIATRLALGKIEDQLSAAVTDHQSALWAWMALRDVVAHNTEVAEQESRASKREKAETELFKAAAKVAHVAPELATLRGNDLVSSTIRQLVLIGSSKKVA